MFGTTSGAWAQDAYRDRGARYSRAQADDGRARTRSVDNTRLERGSYDAVRREDDSRFRSRDSFDNRFSRQRHDSRFDRGHDLDRFDRRHDDRFDRFDRHDSRSRITVGLNYHYTRPYSHYSYVPRYRSSTYYSPYVYRPAYYSTYTTTYCPPPVKYVTYTSYRPYAGWSYCPPAYYPRYSYPRSGFSFGIRYDYRR